MSSRILLITAISLIALIAGSTIALLGGNAIYPGVQVSGVALGGLTLDQAEARLAPRIAQLSAEKVTLRYGGSTMTASTADLGGRIDARACVEAAYRIGRDGNIFKRISDIISAKRNGGELPVAYIFDEKQASEYLQAASRHIGTPPVNAKLVVEGDLVSITPERPGMQLNVDRSLDRIRQTINSGAREAELVVTTAAPKVTASDLQGIDSTIASYSTVYKTWQKDRTHNLRLACRSVDGTLLKPGDVFSYNKTVGPRLEEFGFRDAPIFVKGEVESGIGGGICQVSTTIYNAVLLANLKIVRRAHHSRPVPYAPVGRDATVAYPAVDFKFKNDTDAPIYIMASVGKRTVDIRLLGKQQLGQEVEIVSVGHKVIPAPVVKKVAGELSDGKKVVPEKGRSGHRVSIYRVVKCDGIVVKRELVSKDYYRPDEKIVVVPAVKSM